MTLSCPCPGTGVGNNREVIVSGRESKVAGSDVSRDICLELNLLPAHGRSDEITG